MFEKGGVPMFDIHRPNVCEIPHEEPFLRTLASEEEKAACCSHRRISGVKRLLGIIASGYEAFVSAQ